MAEKLIGPVDKVYFHCDRVPRRLMRVGIASAKGVNCAAVAGAVRRAGLGGGSGLLQRADGVMERGGWAEEGAEGFVAGGGGVLLDPMRDAG